MTIQIKRIYDPVQENDGIRYLVDRLWARGVSKEKSTPRRIVEGTSTKQ